MKNNMSFRFFNEKKLRDGTSALVIGKMNNDIIEFEYLEWHKISRTYWKRIEITGYERFPSKPTSVYSDFSSTKAKTKLINRITAIIDKVKSEAKKNKFKSIYRLNTPNLVRRVSYNEFEIYDYHDNVLEVSEIMYHLRLMDLKYGNSSEDAIFVVFEKPLFKNSNNFGDMKTVLRKQLKSNPMKKSPVKKTSLTKSCKKMTGDVKKMGNQLNKNLKKLI